MPTSSPAVVSPTRVHSGEIGAGPSNQPSTAFKNGSASKKPTVANKSIPTAKNSQYIRRWMVIGASCNIIRLRASKIAQDGQV
jgi:hypothetical protein